MGETNTIIMGDWNSVVEIKHIKTMLDHLDWEGGIRDAKCLLTSVKGMDLIQQTHGSKSLKGDCTPGNHQRIRVDINWTMP
jgi:hypothetical protein